MWKAAVLAAAAWFGCTSASLACIGQPYVPGIAFFETVPDHAPPDALILDVIFDDHRPPALNSIAVARVRRVLRGDYAGDTIAVGIGGSDCQDTFQFGRSGIVVGHLVTPAEGQALYDRWSETELEGTTLRLTWPHQQTVFEPVHENAQERLARNNSAPLRPYSAFDSLKALVGDWQGRTESGRTFLVSYRLIANGTALVETWTMSPTRTSMTVYHMDGADTLVATHYCPQGNQPRLQYRPELSGRRLEFTFRDATNLPDPNAAHQHAIWIEIGPGAGAFARSETYVENGEAGSETTTFASIPQPASNP